MYGQAAGRRPVGVKIPDDQNTERSDKADLTVESLTPIEFFAAQFIQNGKVVTGLICLNNGEFYLAPDGDVWLSKMRPISARMAKNVIDAHRRLTKTPIGDVPTKDDVEVLESVLPDAVDVMGAQ